METDSPRDQAAACSNAIGELAKRFRQRGGLTSEQLATLERAKAVYDGRIELLGGGQAERQRDTAVDQEEEADERETGEDALLAVGCIQKLAQAG